MGYHLALAICKVPTTLGPGEFEEIRYRAGGLQQDDPTRHVAVVEEVITLEHAACEEIHDGLVARGLEGEKLEAAERSAHNLLANRWLCTALDTLLLPLVTPESTKLERGERNRRELPYDVQSVILDGNRYLISGTLTSGDPNESYPLVSLLDASGVCEGFYEGVCEEQPAPPAMVTQDGLRCTQCGYKGDEGGGFTAIGDALVTACLNRAGECATWKNAEHHDAGGYRKVRCERCGADLGDLEPEDLAALGSASDGEEARGEDVRHEAGGDD